MKTKDSHDHMSHETNYMFPFLCLLFSLFCCFAVSVFVGVFLFCLLISGVFVVFSCALFLFLFGVPLYLPDQKNTSGMRGPTMSCFSTVGRTNVSVLGATVRPSMGGYDSKTHGLWCLLGTQVVLPAVCRNGNCPEGLLFT